MFMYIYIYIYLCIYIYIYLYIYILFTKCSNLLIFFFLDGAQGHMNGAPIETRTHSCRFASLAC